MSEGKFDFNLFGKDDDEEVGQCRFGRNGTGSQQPSTTKSRRNPPHWAKYWAKFPASAA